MSIKRKLDSKGSALNSILSDGAKEMIISMVILKVYSIIKSKTHKNYDDGKVVKLYRPAYLSVKNTMLNKLIKGLVKQEVDMYYHCIEDNDKVKNIKQILKGEEKDIIFMAENVINYLELLCEGDE